MRTSLEIRPGSRKRRRVVSVMSRPLAAKGADACLKHVLNTRQRAGLPRHREAGNGAGCRQASGLGRFVAHCAVRLNLWSPFDPNEEHGLADAQTRVRPIADIAVLYKEEAPRLRRRFVRRGHLIEDAADLVQRSFVRLLRISAADRAEIGTPAAYVARIAGNLARDDARAASRRPPAIEFREGDVSQSQADPSRQLEARDMLARVDHAIRALPARTGEIFMAHRFEGETYPAIAERMGISVKTVEKHISLALVALHRLLAEPE